MDGSKFYCSVLIPVAQTGQSVSGPRLRLGKSFPKFEGGACGDRTVHRWGRDADRNGQSDWIVSADAFVFALGSVLLLQALTRLQGGGTQTLVLFGIALVRRDRRGGR